MAHDTNFFIITICQYVEEMAFPLQTLCSGPDVDGVDKAVREGMATLRGEGYEQEDGFWDYGGVMAEYESIEPIPSDLAVDMLERGILTHWIEL